MAMNSFLPLSVAPMITRYYSSKRIPLLVDFSAKKNLTGYATFQIPLNTRNHYISADPARF